LRMMFLSKAVDARSGCVASLRPGGVRWCDQ
jgi:hypothetical protein